MSGGGKVFVSIARQNSSMYSQEVEMAYMPKSASSVKFDVEPHSITIDAPYRPVRIEAITTSQLLMHHAGKSSIT
ncbi:DUF6470 family protein [Alteribacillus sp. HJP-4]|uniref:DUF6470 family protein n=1 Tax=Alteribacillus sp. HJP-4 TaxID=2775394 RepID=UPI0035CD1E4D